MFVEEVQIVDAVFRGRKIIFADPLKRHAPNTKSPISPQLHRDRNRPFADGAAELRSAMSDTSAVTDRKHCDTVESMWADGRRPDGIAPGWIDDMVRRLFKRWSVLMLRLENRTAEKIETPNERKQSAHDARMLVLLQRSLEGMIELENARCADRSTKAPKDHDKAAADFDRRFAALAKAAGVAGFLEEPEAE